MSKKKTHCRTKRKTPKESFSLNTMTLAGTTVKQNVKWRDINLPTKRSSYATKRKQI